MADENVDLRFLGRQVQTLQGDVRDLRADHLRLEGDVAGLRAELTRLSASSEAGFESVAARFDHLEPEMRTTLRALDSKLDQFNQTVTTSLDVILTSLRNR